MSASRQRGKSKAADTARLIAHYLPMVRRVCGAHLNRHTDVEDAVQETFVQFLQADRHRIKNVEAWLVTVAVRVCGHVHRWRYGHPEVELSDEARPAHDGRAFDDALHSLWFSKLLTQLSHLDREALTLLYVHDLPRESVAQHLGISVDHLRVVIFRARKRTQRIIAAYNDGMEL